MSRQVRANIAHAPRLMRTGGNAPVPYRVEPREAMRSGELASAGESARAALGSSLRDD